MLNSYNKNLYWFNEKELKYEPHKGSNFKILVTVVVAFLLLGATSIVKINHTFEKIPVIIDSSKEECTLDKTYKLAKEIGIKFPDIYVAMVAIESGNLSSPIYTELNNLTCMEYTRGRPSLGKNTGKRFARFDDWKQSVYDFAIWQTYCSKSNISREDYFKLLDRVYCPSNLEENKGPLYSERIKDYLKTHKYE